jgi:Ti-type conjugative transfer relaxase TraA
VREKTAEVAIYHLTAKVVSRAKGQSVVAAAAYRASEALHDERYGLTHDYTRKEGVEHSEILLPDGAPKELADRQTLWNQVDANEKRKDSQLARELEIGLPVELTHGENVELVRDYLKKHFVSKGMVADFSVHEDDPNNPHAHVLLTMREMTPEGFGPKVRAWNAKADLLKWRETWAETANEHLARAGHAVRIDHRTLEAQNIELEPGRKIGIGQERQGEKKLPRHIAERIKDSERIARENGELILADPSIALRSMTHQRSTFTERDIAKFLHTRTQSAEQFQAAFLKVTTSDELVALGKDDRNIVRYTTRDMLEAEKSLLNRSKVLDARRQHGVAASRQASALSLSNLSAEQEAAFGHITAEGDLKALVGVAGSGKSTLLAAARQAWEAEGLTVKGAALSGIAAENLELASGIKARTLASYEYTWKEGRDALTRNDVLVIDEAGMIGTKQLERMLAAADKAHAKVVLVGDPEQLQAIEAGAAFRGVIGRAGLVELTQVRRQKEAWARDATQQLANGRTLEALKAYDSKGALHGQATREEAQSQLLDAWSKDRADHPAESRLILAYTRNDVQDLNRAAREILKEEGELGAGQAVQTTRGAREFAAGDRIMFLRNEKSLGVKNGTLGTVERIGSDALQVRLDGKDEKDETRIAVETKNYQDLDYGYASTIHKSQGATVDRSYVLASKYFDRHTSYVALSRHREAAMLFYAQDEFANPRGQGAAPDPGESKHNLEYTLARARPKELAHDYLDLGAGAKEPAAHEHSDNSPEAIQARARDAWAAARAKDQQSGATPEEIQRLARERWQEFRQGTGQGREGQEKPAATKSQDRSLGKDDDQSL